MTSLPHFPTFPQASTRTPTKPVADSGDSPSAYGTGQDVEVRYSPQGSGAAKPVDTVVLGPTKVLESSEQLLDGWRSAAGAPPKPSGGGMLGGLGSTLFTPNTPAPADPLLTQVENDVVKVNHSSKQPLAHLDGGELEGDPSITSPFVTANQVHNGLEDTLGRDVAYRSDDGRLNINVDTKNSPSDLSPYHTHATGTLTFPNNGNGSTLANDPDVVAHEQGHAILDSQRPNLGFSPESKATHEAFADGTAFFNSLKQDEVRQDTIQRWDKPTGDQSGLAANVGEAGPAHFGDTHAHHGEGIRDLSGDAPTGDVHAHGHHKDSVKFGSGLHDSTRDVYQQIRKDNPDLTSDQAFTQATDRVGSDFTRSLDFLPPGGEMSQNDLAAAMMKANKIDGGGEQNSVYQRNFEEAGLRPVTGDTIAQEAGVTVLRDQISLPDKLAGKNYESDREPAGSATATAATNFINENGGKMGIPQDFNMSPSRVYSNERGETFMLFDGGRQGENPLDGSTREHLGLGFDKEGQLIHFDSAQEKKAPLTMPGTGMPGTPFPQSSPFPTGQLPLPFPGFGGGHGHDHGPTGQSPRTGGSGTDSIPIGPWGASPTTGGSGTDTIPGKPTTGSSPWGTITMGGQGNDRIPNR